MQNSGAFKEWILAERRYTSYVTEIDIYCGLSRGDVAIIDYLSAKFAEIAAELAEVAKPLARTDRLEKLSLPVVKKGETAALADSINKQLTMSTEQWDEIVEEGSPQSSVKPSATRAEVAGILPIWILTLRAYTVSLKNFLRTYPKRGRNITYKRCSRDGRR